MVSAQSTFKCLVQGVETVWQDSDCATDVAVSLSESFGMGALHPHQVFASQDRRRKAAWPPAILGGPPKGVDSTKVPMAEPGRADWPSPERCHVSYLKYHKVLGPVPQCPEFGSKVHESSRHGGQLLACSVHQLSSVSCTWNSHETQLGGIHRML